MNNSDQESAKQIRQLKVELMDQPMNLAIERGILVEVNKDDVDFSKKFLNTLEKIAKKNPKNSHRHWIINTAIEMTKGMSMVDRVEVAMIVFSVAEEKMGNALFKREFQ